MLISKTERSLYSRSELYQVVWCSMHVHGFSHCTAVPGARTIILYCCDTRNSGLASFLVRIGRALHPDTRA